MLRRTWQRRWCVGQCMKVSIDYGPVNYPLAQGAIERVGQWVREVLFELTQESWRRIWHRYVIPACWIHLVTPDPSLWCGICGGLSKINLACCAYNADECIYRLHPSTI